MAKLTRRSVLRSSLALGAAGALAHPYIANAAAKTMTMWWTQGFAPEEDVSIKKIVANYEKASGNTIDLSIMPYAPLRQKVVSAVTSGVVPDLFPNQPVEIIALFSWENKLVDLSDVIATQREEYTETALATALCYNSVKKSAAFTAYPIPKGYYRTTSGGRWSRRPVIRWRTSRRPGTPITISSRACRRNCASSACATSMGSVST